MLIKKDVVSFSHRGQGVDRDFVTRVAIGTKLEDGDILGKDQHAEGSINSPRQKLDVHHTQPSPAM
jgi:hypothetical protein